MSELLGVLDARTLDVQLPRVAAWAQAVGIDPRDTYRIELRYDGRLVARVFDWAVNEKGVRYCPRDHDHRNFADTCEIARREPYDVTIIGAAGVQAIRERVKAWADVMANASAALAPVLAVVRLQRKAIRTEYRRRARRRNR